MGMRSIWTGNVSFLMVSVPCKLYSATSDRTKELRRDIHQIHGECGTQIEVPKWCPKCQKRLESFEVKKAYFADRPVVLEEADFKSLPLKSLQSIEITSFIDGSQIDPRAYSDSYLVAPEVGYADELRDYAEIRPHAVNLSEQETEIAKALVSKLSGDWHHAEYTDAYNDALEAMIQAKLTGAALTIPTAETPTPTGDAADAFLKSLELAGAEK